MSDLESVLTRIEALLRGDAVVDQAAGSDAVAAYIELVEPAALCMARCAGWAQRGLFFEAVSVADDYPRLSAVGRRLLQGDLAARVAARMQKLAPAGRTIPLIDPNWLAAIEAAEAEVERSGGLVEKHQALSLSRAPITDRIKAIRSLVRSDPASPVWGAELRRIEDAALADCREGLRAAFEKGDAEGVRRTASEILNDQWTRTVPEEIRREARAALDTMQTRHGRARYLELESRIREAADRADQEALSELEMAWVRVAQETGVEPSPDAEAAVAGAFQWLARQRQAAAQDAEFAAQVAQLDHLVATRADEASVSGQLAAVKRLDRELPPGLEQRVQFHLRSIHAARTRRLVGRIAAVVAAMVAVAALVLWRMQRSDVEGAANRIAQQVKELLDRSELEQARELIAKNPDLAREAPLVAAASEVSQREPAWKQDRERAAALIAEMKDAVGGEIAPTKRTEFEARQKDLDPRLTQVEKQQLAELQRQASDQASRYMASLRDRYAAAAEAWRKQAAEVPSLDALPAGDRYAKAALERLSARAAELSESGVRLCQEYGQLPQDTLASTRTEIDRLRKAGEAFAERRKSIQALEQRYADVVATASTPDRLVPALDKLLSECAAAVDGLGLSNALRSAREVDVATLKLTASWNPLAKAISGSKLLESGTVPPPELVEALRKFVDEKPESDLTVVAKAVLSVADVGSKDGSMGVGERLKLHLEEQRLQDLKVVPLQGGGRFWRHLAEPEGVFGSGVLRTRDDVARAELPGLPPPTPVRVPGVRVEQSPTAQKIQMLQSALPTVGLVDARQRVLAAIGDIAITAPTTKPGDEGAAFRLWVVMKLVEMWQDELKASTPLPTDLELERIATEVRAKHAAAVDFDWARPALNGDQVRQVADMNAAAAVALKAFADVPALAAKDRDQIRSLTRGLRPLAPAGLVAFDPFEQKPRAYGLPSTGTLIVFEPEGAVMRMRRVASLAELLKVVQERRIGPVLVLKEEPVK